MGIRHTGKKVIAILLMAGMLLPAASLNTTIAASVLSATAAVSSAKAVAVYVNGQPLKTAVPPVVVSGIAYAELQPLLKSLGFAVTVNRNQIVAKSKALDWRFDASTLVGKINGQYTAFKSAIWKKDGRIYLSLRTVADVLGADLTGSAGRYELKTAQPEARFLQAIAAHDRTKAAAIVRSGMSLDSAAFAVKPMQAAVAADDKSMVGYLIQRQGRARLNEIYAGGDTPLLIAIRNRSTDMIAYLIAQGADRNMAAPNQAYPLFVAIGTGSEDVVRALLATSPDQNILNLQGRTPIQEALLADRPGIALLLAQSGANLFAPVMPGTRDVFDYLNGRPEYASYTASFVQATNTTFSMSGGSSGTLSLPFGAGMDVKVKSAIVLERQLVARITVESAAADKLTVVLPFRADKIYRATEKEQTLFIPMTSIPRETCVPVDDRTLAECNAKMQIYREKVAAAEADRKRRLEEAKNSNIKPLSTLPALEVVPQQQDGTAVIAPLTGTNAEYWIYLPIDGRSQVDMKLSLAVDGQIRTNYTIRYDASQRTPPANVPKGMEAA
ncbi:ankyrin repeat domain-containing protein [Cohnella sp. GCM10020058]|uniref:ankyrin repeat domain-containing protein n=1 Tax=Cohnella sp. GCM10020058 TaxID=3317330 RepID=UPI00363F0951